MKDLKASVWLILVILLIYALISGVTMNGKHYGLRDCNSREGLVIDNGVAPDAGGRYGMNLDPGIRGRPPEPWPRCPHCGGPARPVGDPPFRCRYALVTRSEANARDRWGKVRRKVEAKSTTFDEVAVALASGQSLPERGPWYVRLTRVALKRLDRGDNLPRALKAVQDEVAAVLRVDDGSDAVEWAYDQASDGAFLGVVVEVWGAPPLLVVQGSE